MKNGNFKCERKIMRCGSNLFKKLMYRMRDISDFDKLANYQHICEKLFGNTYCEIYSGRNRLYEYFIAG